MCEYLIHFYQHNQFFNPLNGELWWLVINELIHKSTIQRKMHTDSQRLCQCTILEHDYPSMMSAIASFLLKKYNLLTKDVMIHTLYLASTYCTTTHQVIISLWWRLSSFWMETSRHPCWMSSPRMDIYNKYFLCFSPIRSNYPYDSSYKYTK